MNSYEATGGHLTFLLNHTVCNIHILKARGWAFSVKCDATTVVATIYLVESSRSLAAAIEARAEFQHKHDYCCLWKSSFLDFHGTSTTVGIARDVGGIATSYFGVRTVYTNAVQIR